MGSGGDACCGGVSDTVCAFGKCAALLLFASSAVVVFRAAVFVSAAGLR